MPYKDKAKQNAYINSIKKYYTVAVSKVSEQDMIDHLEMRKPVNRYIKTLIRKDMEAQK